MSLGRNDDVAAAVAAVRLGGRVGPIGLTAGWVRFED